MNLQEKLENIRKQKEQALATVNACIGAEQILLELIKESEDIGTDEHSGD